MEYTAQNAEYAVSVFYNGEQTDRANAHTWLTTAQRVPEAWNFVWQLLQPTKGTEVQFYGATTLHTKILRCWNEVPPESYDELKEKLLQAVFTYSKGPKIVTNRLCISLAAFILQQGNIDLATILRPLSNVENSMLLLEVLTVIPEEYNSMTMGTALRTKNRGMLRQACSAVLADMLRYLQTVYNDFSKEPPSEELIQSWTMAANCAGSWLGIDGVDEEIAPPLPDRMPLFRALLTVVHVLYSCNEIVSDTALEACETCLSGARAAGDAGLASRYPGTALQMLAFLSALAGPIMQRDNVPNSPNEELLSALMSMCVALGLTHARSIVDAVEGGDNSEPVAGTRQLLEVLLQAQAAPGYYPIHETRSNVVFGFWYTLQDEILNIMEQKLTVNSIWCEVFSRLLGVLVSKSEAPADSALNKDDLELLRCYRQDIGDTLVYCFAVVGESCWARVEAAYTEASSDARREAALHVFGALADAAPHERAPAGLCSMMRHCVAQAQTSTHERTLHTALDALGMYASWLASLTEPEEPRVPDESAPEAELARACIRAAGDALARSPPAAAMALRKLCADLPRAAAHHAKDIAHAAQNSEALGLSTQRSLVVAAGNALWLTKPEEAEPLLRGLAAMIHRNITHQVAGPATAARCGTECAAALLLSLSRRPDLVIFVFQAIANTLPPLAANPAHVKDLYPILKNTVTALLRDAADGSALTPVLDQVGELALAGLRTRACSSSIDLVKLITLGVGTDWSGTRALLRACVVSVTAALMPNPDVHPGLAETLFFVISIIIKKRPQYVDWIEDLLPQLVELGHESIRMWEERAARAACSFLSQLAGVRPAAVQPVAPALTAAALMCIGGATPRNQIEPLADLLLGLNRAAWRDAELATWLRDSLCVAGFPTLHATDTHKHKFIAAVVKEKSSKRRLLESVQEFSLVCRGLVGTEYARQSVASKQLVA